MNQKMISSADSSPLQKSIQTTSVYSDFDLQYSPDIILQECYPSNENENQNQNFPQQKPYLNKKGLDSIRNWTSQDQNQLIQFHKKLGNKWTRLAQHFTGMSQNSIKNRFYSRLRKSVRKLNKMIDLLKLKQYTKFKLNIIFQLSNLSQSKLLEKQRVDPQIFHFYKEFLYELIQFSNQNQSQKIQNEKSSHLRYRIESLILPMIALENLFRLVRGERAAKGRKKNIAYLRQFNFRLSLQNSTQMIITKESIYLDNYVHPQIPSLSHQISSQNQNKEIPLVSKESTETNYSTRTTSEIKSYQTQDLPVEVSQKLDEEIQQYRPHKEFNQVQSNSLAPIWRDYLGFQMREYDIYGQEERALNNHNHFNILNVRGIEYQDENEGW